MAVQTAPRQSTDAGQLESDYDRGYGWLMFAGTMLALAGTLNFIEGIAAVSKSHFFVGNAQYVFGDLNTWGWVVLCIGVIQGAAGVGILFRNQLARWVGIAAAGLNALAQLLFIQGYPFWSLALFSIDLLIIYGLVAYGGRSRAV
jgi:hypothetical protein